MNLGQSDIIVNFAIVDAARAGTEIAETLNLAQRSSSLFRDSTLSDVAPHLGALAPDSGGLESFISRCWGKSSAIFLHADVPFDQVSKHFRKFLMVKTESGAKLYFRFYDPRVLRVFLPTCDAQQLIEFFGPIHYFLLEDVESNTALIFWIERRSLKVERIDLTNEIVASRLPEELRAVRVKEKPNVIV